MGKREKVSVDVKVRLVQQYLRGELTVSEAAQRVKVYNKTVTGWIKMYENEGLEGFMKGRRNRSYSPEIKKAAVSDYLEGRGNQREICNKYGIRSDKQLRNWIKGYNALKDSNSGVSSGREDYMKQGRATTQEERIGIARECIASGKNYAETAQKYRVSYQQVRNWTLRYEELGEVGLEDRRGRRKKDQEPRTELEQAQIEIEKLRHKLYLSEMENTLLKKLDEVERRDVCRK